MTETTKITKDQGHEFTAFLNKNIQGVQYLQSVGIEINDMVEFMRTEREKLSPKTGLSKADHTTFAVLNTLVAPVTSAVLLTFHSEARKKPITTIKSLYCLSAQRNKFDAQTIFSNQVSLIKFGKQLEKDTLEAWEAEVSSLDMTGKTFGFSDETIEKLYPEKPKAYVATLPAVKM